MITVDSRNSYKNVNKDLTVEDQVVSLKAYIHSLHKYIFAPPAFEGKLRKMYLGLYQAINQLAKAGDLTSCALISLLQFQTDI